MLSRYDIRVDPASPNNAHAFAVDLVGWNRRVLELGAASGHVTRALEHLLRPHDVLRRAAQLLRPGGQVVVSLPNVGHVDLRLSLMQGAWDYRPWGLMDDTHIRFFTLKNIKAMVREAGLIITDLRRVRIPAFETELRIDRIGRSDRNDRVRTRRS